jgi:uncharacterized membrane protein
MFKNFLLNTYTSITSTTLGVIVFAAVLIGIVFTLDLIPFMVDVNYGWLSAVFVGVELVALFIFLIYSAVKSK